MSLESQFITLTNTGGVHAYVGAVFLKDETLGPAWPVDATLYLLDAPSGVPGALITATTRVGPIPNMHSHYIVAYVSSGSMLNASTPYRATIFLTMYRQASGGSVIDAQTIPVTINVNASAPDIELGGTLAFSGVVGNTIAKTAAMTVKNIGHNPSNLTWASGFTLDAGITGKMSVLPATGLLAYNATDNLVVSFDPTGVVAGTYAGTINISESVVPGITTKTLPISATMLPAYAGGLMFKSSNWGYWPNPNWGGLTGGPFAIMAAPLRRWSAGAIPSAIGVHLSCMLVDLTAGGQVQLYVQTTDALGNSWGTYFNVTTGYETGATAGCPVGSATVSMQYKVPAAYSDITIQWASSL